MPVDLRARKLAQLAVKYSIAAKPGDKVIISGGDEALPFLTELYKAVILQQAIPIIRVNLSNISDFFYKYANKEQLDFFPDYWFDTVKKAQCYIGVHTDENTKQLTSASSEKITKRQKLLHPISDYIVNTRDKIRRVTIAYPCTSHAQEAELSLTEHENFVYQACLQDWKKLGKQMNKIKSKFKEGSQVHLLGEGVDLKFKVHGGEAVAGIGQENMPDGEIYMAPFRESLNGWIKFEYPAIESGKEVTDISLKFENGKVIEYDAAKNKDLLKAKLETDANSSYVGEFGIGCNPKINKFTKNLLFDEKISGTIHLALGMAYKDNGGGNDSAIHWDIVKDMHKAKIIVDGKTIQVNGNFKI